MKIAISINRFISQSLNYWFLLNVIFAAFFFSQNSPASYFSFSCSSIFYYTLSFKSSFSPGGSLL